MDSVPRFFAKDFFHESGAWGKLIHVKNMKSKISWHCPFKVLPAWTLVLPA